MKRINNNAIIATDQEMVDAGLFECKPADDIIRLWLQRKNTETGRWGFMPIIEVTNSFVKTDSELPESGHIVRASTHTIEDYYIALESDAFDLRPILDSAGVEYRPLTSGTRYLYALEYEDGGRSLKLWKTKAAAAASAIEILMDSTFEDDSYIDLIRIDTFALAINNDIRVLKTRKNL